MDSIEDLKREINSKNKKLKELQDINDTQSSRIKELETALNETRTAEIELERTQLSVEEYKASEQNLKSQLMEYKSLKNGYETLQLKYNNERQRNQKLTFELKNNTNKIINEYKQRLDTVKKAKEQEIRNYKNELEIYKRQKNNIISNDNELYLNNLKELQDSHDKIENDLKMQIDEMKEMMEQRERSSQNIINETNRQFDEYKNIMNDEINTLNKKLSQFENGDVEVILRIDVNDPISHKPPPKRPAPLLPYNITVTNHSRNVSQNGSINSSNYSPTGSIKINNEYDTPKGNSGSKPRLSDFFSAPTTNGTNTNDDEDTKTMNNNNNNNNNLNGYNNHNRLKSADMYNNTIKAFQSKSEANIYDTKKNKNNIDNFNDNDSIVSDISSHKNSIVFENLIINKNIINSKSENYTFDKAKLPRQRSHSSVFALPKSLTNYKSKNLFIKTNNNNNNKDLTTFKNRIRNSIKWSFTPTTTNHKYNFPDTENNHSMLLKKKKRKDSSLGSFSSWVYKDDINDDNISVTSASSYNNKLNGYNNELKRKTIAQASETNKLLIKMHERQIANLSENLKIAHKTNMVLKQRAHHKYKVLDQRLKAERKKWIEKELQYQQKIDDITKALKDQERQFKERWIELNNKANLNNNNIQINSETQEQINTLKNQLIQLQKNNFDITKQSNGYKVEINQLKRTLMNCNTIIKQLQDEITSLRNKMNNLEYENTKYKNYQKKLKKSKPEEILEQKVKLLLNQRKTLAQEVRNLQEKNEQLKALIANGGMNSNNYMSSNNVINRPSINGFGY